MTSKYLPSFFLCAFLATFSVWVVHPHLIIAPQAYPDFIAGLIGFADYNKTLEGVHFFIWLAVYFVLMTVVRFFCTAKEADDTMNWFITSVWMFLGVAIGKAFIKTELSLTTVTVVTTGILLLQVKDLKIQKAISQGFFAALLTLIAAVGSLVLLSLTGNYSDALVAPTRIYVGSAMVAASIIFGILEYRGHATIAHRSKILLQLPAVFIWLKFFNLGTFGAAGFSPYTMSTAGISIFSLIELGSLLLLVKDFFGAEKNYSISYATLVAAAFLFGFYFPPPSTLTADPFHLGEMMLPWHQIFVKGLKSYSEFVPVQGLISYAIGACNAIFYHGEIATFSVSTSLMTALVGVIIALVYAWSFGIAIAFLFTPLALSFLDRFYLTGISFLILSYPALLAKPQQWFAVATMLLSITFFWNAPSTISLTLGCAPIGMVLLWRSQNRVATLLPALCIGLVAVGVLPIFGVAQFVYENGFINTVQHSSMLIENWRDQGAYATYFTSLKANRILWESIRVGGWMWAAALLFTMQLAIIKKRTIGKADVSMLGAFLLTTGGILFALLLFPYSMGRIDPPINMSRPGTISMVLLSFFVPFAFFYIKKYRSIQVIHPLMIGLLVGRPLGIKGTSISAMLDFPRAQPGAPADYIRTNGAQVHIENLGEGYFPSAVIDTITRLQSALDLLITRDETYVDLTNHSAYHALLNRRFTALYASANAVGFRIQERMLKTFDENPPAVVLVAPFTEIDRTSIALRNSRLYRWLMTHRYHLIEIDGFSFLVSDPKFQAKHITEQPLAQLQKVVFRAELAGVPRAWGKSYATLKRLVNEVPVPTQIVASHNTQLLNEGWNDIQSEDASVTFSLESISRQTLFRSDYLYLKLETMTDGAQKPNFGVTVSYRKNLVAPGNEPLPEKLSFWGPAGGGVVVVPVATDPRWFVDTPTEVTLSFGNEVPGARWRIKAIKLLSLQ